jgi:phosphotransferase system HPr (HPr) family protein
MITKEFKIKNETGLHARPAALLVKVAAKFKSKIIVSKDGFEVNGKSIMGVMTLAAEKGSQIVVTADGKDEDRAIRAIADLIDNKFNED